jgi:hypothetical protein
LIVTPAYTDPIKILDQIPDEEGTMSKAQRSSLLVAILSFVFLFSISTQAMQDILNFYPLDFAKIALAPEVWNKSFEDQSSPSHQELKNFVEFLKAEKLSAQALAQEILKSPTTYNFKYQFLRYLMSTPKDKAKFPQLTGALNGVWEQIPQVYLRALILMIETSPVNSFYAPIIQRLNEMQNRNEFKFVDLTDAVRANWAGVSDSTHASNKATTLTKDPNGKYVVNALYNNKTKVFALDLRLSRDENLITFAHEIVHIADPELDRQRSLLEQHFARLVEKLKPLFPNGQVEEFLRNLIQDTFMEQGRLDISAAVPQTSVVLTAEAMKEGFAKTAQDIKDAGYDKLLADEDLTGFIRSLISVTVENEYKAYILSYSLYSALVDKNPELMPPSEKRDDFIRKNFDHPGGLQDTLKDEARPLKNGAILMKLMPQITSLTPEQLAGEEIKAQLAMVNAFKKIIQTVYFNESRKMIERTSNDFSSLYSLISRTRFSVKKDQSLSEKDEEFYMKNPWLRPGQYNDSIKNPYLLAEAELGTKSIIEFGKSLDGLRQSLQGTTETLVVTLAGVLPLSNLNLGELKSTGLMPLDADPATAMPRTCKVEDLRDLQSVDREALDLFQRFTYNVSNASADQNYLEYAAAERQIYAMQLYKILNWLRKEFPVTRENFATLDMFRKKLNQNYIEDEIPEKRVKELIKKIDDFGNVAKLREEDLRSIQYLMFTMNMATSAARKLNMVNLAQEFEKRISVARQYFQRLGVEMETVTMPVETSMQRGLDQFLTELSNSDFAKVCAVSNDFLFNRTPLTFHFGARTISNLTLFCNQKKLYVLRLPCGWFSGSTTSTSDPHGVVTQIFVGGRKLIMQPIALPPGGRK